MLPEGLLHTAPNRLRDDSDSSDSDNDYVATCSFRGMIIPIRDNGGVFNDRFDQFRSFHNRRLARKLRLSLLKEKGRVHEDDELHACCSSDESNETALAPKFVIITRKNKCNQNDFEINNDSTDVTLILDEQKLSAHKQILSSNSDYFDRMFASSFQERDQDQIKLNITHVSFETLTTLIKFFYSSKLTITEDNVQDLLVGSNILLLEDVREACIKYLKCMIDSENCINMKSFADSLGLTELYSLCLTFIIKNFRLVANNEEFLTVTYDEIMLFIKNDELFAKEEMVYDAVMNWIRHDPAVRSKYCTDLLWYVRLPLVLNTYQGIIKVHEFQGARINGLSSFRMEHRKPFRKGILVLSHFPHKSTPEWYDAAVDQWHICVCDNCQCKTFQVALQPPRYLCTCTLLGNGNLFAAGGSELSKGLRVAFIFDSKSKEWVNLPDMHYERIKPFIMQQGPKVFVVAGITDHKSPGCSLIEYYDLKKKKWYSIEIAMQGGSFSTKLKHGVYAASVNHLIYVIGPLTSGVYNTMTNSWNLIPQLPEKKLGAAICALNNNIYIIGGKNYGHYCRTVWAYCTETKEWLSVAQLNTPRSYAGAVVMNGFIYVFGGQINSYSYSNTFEVYNPYENEWKTSVALFSKTRCNIDAIVVEKSSTLFKRIFEDATNNIIH